MLMAENKQLALAIIYSSKKITTFNETENKIKVALSTLIKKISDSLVHSHLSYLPLKNGVMLKLS